jgi:hypothetical protein
MGIYATLAGSFLAVNGTKPSLNYNFSQSPFAYNFVYRI